MELQQKLNSFEQKDFTKNYSCHNQAVKRQIKMVTEAYFAVVEFNKRDHVLIARRFV